MKKHNAIDVPWPQAPSIIFCNSQATDTFSPLKRRLFNQELADIQVPLEVPDANEIIEELDKIDEKEEELEKEKRKRLVEKLLWA